MAAVSGVYTLVKSTAVISTAITSQQVTAPAGTMAEFTRCWLNQSTITATAATRVQFLRKSTAATVVSQNPAALGNGMQASKCVGGTGATGVTASAEGTDGVVFIEEGFNIVGSGWIYLPVPEERVYIINTTAGIKFPTAPTSASYISGQEFLEYAS